MLRKLVQTQKAKLSRESTATLRGPFRNRDCVACQTSILGVPRQASEGEVSALLGLWPSGRLSALPKGIQPIGQPREIHIQGNVTENAT